MSSQLPGALLVAGLAGAGLWASNFAFDRGVPHYLSRKIGHVAGGLSFLAAYLFVPSVWAMALGALFGGVLLFARLLKPVTFRGVGGSGRSSRVIAEIWFALVAVPVTFISWYWLKRPDIAITSLLFMAWGDAVTGLVRARVYRRPTKGWWGSLAMLIVCGALAAVFIRPVWIGLLATLPAVAAEYACGDVGSIRWADDNLVVPLVGMATLLLLMLATGNLVVEAA